MEGCGKVKLGVFTQIYFPANRIIGLNNNIFSKRWLAISAKEKEQNNPKWLKYWEPNS